MKIRCAFFSCVAGGDVVEVLENQPVSTRAVRTTGEQAGGPTPLPTCYPAGRPDAMTVAGRGGYFLSDSFAFLTAPRRAAATASSASVARCSSTAFSRFG